MSHRPILLALHLTFASGATWLGHPSERSNIYSRSNGIIESHQHWFSDCLQHRHRAGRAWYHYVQHHRHQFDVKEAPDWRASPSLEV